MSETIKCACSHCGAKYRLPQEAQGRAARCKKCGEKFKVPVKASLEDSVLDWLADPSKEEDLVEQPRVVTMPKRTGDANATGIRRAIRLKSQPTDEDDSSSAALPAKKSS